ncbi:GAF and ANTAR domain-containing protein [Egibacter rhizosphaerae]|nr:GAF and ANTAR domain-containing protein [Egibacter rhizosphaerae]
MSRERRIIENLVYLSDSLLEDFDADELLGELCERCVELLDVDAAGVMLAMDPEQLRAVAASSVSMDQLEVFEVAAAEGPSYGAYVAGAPVVEADLNNAADRWPRFVPRALELGFVGGYGFPLRLRGRTIGALNLFQEAHRQPLGDTDAVVAKGLADVAAITLMQEEIIRSRDTTVSQLTHALEARVAVEQAKGLLAERLGISPHTAFERMREHARSHRRKVRDVADDLLAGRPLQI